MPTAPITLGRIRLGGKEITYRMRVSTRARRLRLSVGPEGVEVVLPAGVPAQKGVEMLTAHAGWLLEKIAQQERRAARQQRQTRGQIAPPPLGSVFLHGRVVRVELHRELAPRSRPKAALHDETLQLFLPVQGGASPQAVLEAWLIHTARLEIAARVKARAREMGVHPTKLSIRDQKTRWGSCSAKGTLSFNWRLVLAPPEVLDYVVVHELAHMLEHNHSARFWKVVARFAPDYLRERKWLKVNGLLLRHKML